MYPIFCHFLVKLTVEKEAPKCGLIVQLCMSQKCPKSPCQSLNWSSTCPSEAPLLKVETRKSWSSLWEADPESATAFKMGQGCQMVYFQTKNSYLGKFGKVSPWKMLVYFMATWSILCNLG
jgi:hypothetical protein